VPDVHEGLPSADADGAVAGRRGQECAEVALDRGLQVQDLLDGVGAGPGQPVEQSVRRHRACVPVPALVLVERVAHASVMAIAARADDLETLLDQAHEHQV
jgi:hypothetical protein